MPDTYIDECIVAKHKVRIFTTNGFQMRGVIVHEDEDHIIVEESRQRKLVYKHAISTISPDK